MKQELVVLVNDKNEEIGTMEKFSAHNADTPLHRAFSSYVFNKKGEFLVTQRAKSKKVFPGIWTNSCCGHPAPGEKTEDAIKRRLAFELGLVPQSITVVLPDFRYRAVMDGIVENEICPVYLVTVDEGLQPNPQEVEDYKWMGWDDFKKELKNKPKVYSYWCKKQVEALDQIENFPKKYLE